MLSKKLSPLFVLLALSACSSNDSTNEAATTTSSPSTAPVSAACVAADLEARVVDGSVDAAGDQRAYAVALTSKSDRTCTIAGAPTVALLNDEEPIDATTDQTEDPSSPVLLTRGESVTFSVQYAERNSPEQAGCVEANFLQIKPPADDQMLRLPLLGDQLATVCPGATLTVSPVRAGVSTQS